MTLSAGDEAPHVTATNQRGETVSLDFEAPTVLYFYPEDGTSGCTTEAAQFQTELPSYSDAGVAVYGVSTDVVASHRAFAEEEGLDYDLLADPEGRVVDAFGVETRGGRASRTTVVLVEGAVERVYQDVDPDGHARTVLRDLLDAGTVDLS